MPDAYANFALSLVATAPSPATTGTSLVVTTGQGAWFPTPPFNATIWPAGVLPTPANAEIVRVTAVAGNTFTIARAQEGSTARTVIVGDQIAATITARTMTDVIPTFRAAVLADSPVLFARLNDATGNFSDLGSLAASGTAPASGYMRNLRSAIRSGDKCVRFGGAQPTGIQWGDICEFTGFAPFSVEFFMKPETTDANYRGLVAKDSNSGGVNGWRLSWKGDVGGVYFERFNASAAIACNIQGIPSGEWNHICGTYDGTTISLYLNGELSGASATSTATNQSLPNLATPLTFGHLSDSPAGNRQFIGYMDEVAIFAAALSQAAVRTHFAAAG